MSSKQQETMIPYSLTRSIQFNVPHVLGVPPSPSLDQSTKGRKKRFLLILETALDLISQEEMFGEDLPGQKEGPPSRS